MRQPFFRKIMSSVNKSKKIDMTQGSIIRNVFLFAVPIVIANILQQLYTTVDTLVIGNFCGAASLAAVGTSAQPVEVLLCVFLGIGSGVSILVSQYIGAGDSGRIKTTCATAISFVYMVGIPIGVVGWLAAPLLLRIMGVPEDAYGAALSYTRIVFMGSLGNIGYNMNAGILRGMGDSKASLWFLVVSCVSNIVLDLVFVAGMGMDVSGAALSTSIAMYISWVISIIYIKKKFPELSFTFIPRELSGHELKRILSLGLPMGLNNSLYSLGHVAMQTLINAQGSTFMAGASIAGRITGVSSIAITAMSQASSTFSGQNYGAGKTERLREGYIKLPLAAGLITVAMGALMIVFRMPILGLFNKDPEVLMYASRYVCVILVSQWAFAVFNNINNFVNGVGKVRFTTVINLLMLWAVRIPSAYIINRFFDGTWVMVGTAISFYFGMICMLTYILFSKSWKTAVNIGNDPAGVR